MTPGQIIQIVLLALKLINWLTGKVDQSEWKRQGYQQALDEQMAALNVSLGLADKAVDEARKASPEERHKSLQEGI